MISPFKIHFNNGQLPQKFRNEDIYLVDISEDI